MILFKKHKIILMIVYMLQMNYFQRSKRSFDRFHIEKCSYQFWPSLSLTISKNILQSVVFVKLVLTIYCLCTHYWLGVPMGWGLRSPAGDLSLHQACVIVCLKPWLTIIQVQSIVIQLEILINTKLQQLLRLFVCRCYHLLSQNKPFKLLFPMASS